MESNELFSETILELYKNPVNSGELKGATHSAELGNPSCGDTVKFFLKVERGVVTDASFVGLGCAISQASASVLTELVKGKPVSELKRMEPVQLFEALGGVIQTRIRCSTLSLSVMKKALGE